jgi:hypothetical protein
MNRIVFFFIANLIITNLPCQVVEVKGTLRDNNGEPLIGATVVVKGTQNGTVADIDGNYSINALVGSILVVSFVGYLPQEFVVTENGTAKQVQKKAAPKGHDSSYPRIAKANNPHKYKDYSRQFQDTSKFYDNPAKGVAVMRSDLTFKISNSKYSTDYSSLRFKGISNKKKKKVLLFENQKLKIVFLPKITFKSSFTIESINRLPNLQNTYAQGKPVLGELVWLGPEYGELFAWGPGLSQLEYDGSSYSYDKNGQLVKPYNGNGTKANSYNPYDFFKNGYQFVNSYRIEHRVNKLLYHVSFSHNNQQGTIPTSRFKRNVYSSGFNLKLNKTKFSGDFLYTDIKGKNSSGGIADYHLMKSVLLTPPSFDNSNKNGKSSSENRNTYYTQLNEQRSAAVSLTDNPYWLVNYAIDNLHSSRKMGKVEFYYQFFSDAKINFSLHADDQLNKQLQLISGDSYIFSNGATNSRTTGLLSYGSQVYLNHLDFNIHNTKISGILFYQFLGNKAKIQRLSGFLYPLTIENEELPNKYNRERLTNTGNIKINMDFNDYVLFSALGHQSYYSDLENTAGYRGGALSGGILLSSFYGVRRLINLLNYCKIYGSIGNDFTAPPLLSDPTQYNSLKLSNEELNNFYPTKEIKYNKSLVPENHKSINLGLEMRFNYNKYALTVEWYKKTVQNAILPIYNEGAGIELDNLAKLHTKGIDATMVFHHKLNGFEFSNHLNFTKFKTVVEDIYQNYEAIPLAGFEFVSSNAIEGKPLGILTGSKYQRDQSGNILIGDDGYPLVATEPGIIGDPNPKFTVGITNTISYRNFDLSLVWEYRRGGAVWNGTRATLDYYGLSAGTEKERNTRNYIFEGVTADGNVNAQPVDFANPNSNFESNRWARYGLTGVSEEYIEDGSCLRLNNLSLKYSLERLILHKIKEFKVGVFVTNIIVIQKYKGVDPESTLFNQPGGIGLDYFNMPSTSSYGISLEIKL